MKATEADTYLPSNLNLLAFDEYADLISTFDVSGLESYGGGSTPLWYYMLGLAGETAEVAEKVFDGRIVAADLGRELGDVLWYAVRAIVKLGFKPSAVTGYPLMIDFQSDRYSLDTLEHFTVGLCGSVKLIDTVKKLYRNSQSDVIPADRAWELAEALGRVIEFIASMGMRLGIDLAEIAAMNVRKLADRSRRNVVRSEGDNR